MPRIGVAPCTQLRMIHSKGLPRLRDNTCVEQVRCQTGPAGLTRSDVHRLAGAAPQVHGPSLAPANQLQNVLGVQRNISLARIHPLTLAECRKLTSNITRDLGTPIRPHAGERRATVVFSCRTAGVHPLRGQALQSAVAWLIGHNRIVEGEPLGLLNFLVLRRFGVQLARGDRPHASTGLGPATSSRRDRRRSRRGLQAPPDRIEGDRRTVLHAVRDHV